MADMALRMDRVYKKFTKGERHDSLRDLIPALASHAFRRVARPFELKKQEFWALQDVSFEIEQGEAVGIIGHNGAGKSTMLKLLCGIMKPSSGRLSVAGKLSALIEVGAGFHADLTGRENVFLNGVILGMTKGEVRRKFDEIVEFSGLAEFIDTPVKRYSSGMYARLGFSVAAHMEPDVLIIDEVLSVGDAFFQEKSLGKMRSVLKSGATVIFVSHNLRAIADLCGRCMLLEKGALKEMGPTSEVIAQYLDQGTDRGDDRKGDAFLTSIRMRDQNGDETLFKSGQKVWVDVEVAGRVRCENLSVSIYFKREGYDEVFTASTQRLGYGTFGVDSGESFSCTFELDLHFARGTYGLGARIYRYDIEKGYDECFPAQTIFVSSEEDIDGVANLYPRVTRWGGKSVEAIGAPKGAVEQV